MSRKNKNKNVFSFSVFGHEDTTNFIFSKIILSLYEIFTVCVHGTINFMHKTHQRIRIKDIARLAGVSEGTVDRVLHNRGEVSARSRAAVEGIMKEMDYSPNLIARSLASKKHYRFVALIPGYKAGDYWSYVASGFFSVAESFVHHNVDIEIVHFNQYDSHSFAASALEILKQLPDAVFIAPVFRNETLTFTRKLVENAVPFSFIDSMIEEAPFHTYYGQNSSQSGFIGSKLMFDTLKENSKVLIIRIQRKGESFSNQTINRYEGFLKYIREVKQCCYELIHVELIDGDEQTNRQLLSDTFFKHPELSGMITFNSKAYRLAAFLKEINRLDVVLVGYDLLEENIHYLKEGVISYLIAQRPEKQAYLTVSDMYQTLIFHQEVQRLNYMPIDILMKENIDYYINFRD